MPETKDEGFDASRIRVKSAEGKLISLDDLQRVPWKKAPSYYRINGPNSIYLSITAEETANQLQLSKQVKEEMEGPYKRCCLPDMKFTPVMMRRNLFTKN